MTLISKGSSKISVERKNSSQSFSNVNAMKRRYHWMEILVAHSSDFPGTFQVSCFIMLLVKQAFT